MNIPYFTCNTIPDFVEKYHNLPTNSTILVDTPAPGATDLNLIQDLQAIDSDDAICEFHLNLSIAEKPLNQDKTIALFAPLGIKSIVFSKMDQTWTFGELFNLPIKWSIPISYFGNGPEIPEDFEVASKERIVSKLFSI